MPPFEGSNPTSRKASNRHCITDSISNIVTINVGGQIFRTTKQTLALAGPKSLLSRIDEKTIPFLDRDPELFSTMLSFLRTGTLSSNAKAFDIQDIISESKYYGIEQLLINSRSNPSQFNGFSLEKSKIIPLNGRDLPSVISATQFGSIHIAHGSKITSLDWSLQRKSTILTEFTSIDSLLALSPNIVAIGATDFSGMQIIDQKGVIKKRLNWENVTKSSSTVQAIGSSPEYLFTSFESGRRNSNCIKVYDIKEGFKPVQTIAHYEIFGADLDSAIPATKLTWIGTHNLLMASGSHSGPSKVLGNIKFWDLRSSNVVYEIKEIFDCFADVTVLNNLSTVFKVGVYSGEVFVSDLRKFERENPWNCLGNRRKEMNVKKEGFGSKMGSYGNQVFCSKGGGDIELWSEVSIDSSMKVGPREFREDLVGQASGTRGSNVTDMEFGGNKMFVARKGQQYIEVWDS